MKLAIMGFGTIGSGVAAIVEQNAALIERRIGAPLEVKYVLALREFPARPWSTRSSTTSTSS